MPVILVYPTADFIPFTKILSADVNGKFNAIKTLLNVTGIPATAINSTGATTGYFLSYNGTSGSWSANPLGQQYNVVIGSAAQVVSGVAQYSAWASYTQVDGDRVLVLPTYATTENVTLSKKLLVEGLGITSVITGTITFATGSSGTLLNNLKVTDNITINSGLSAIFCKNIFQTSGKTYLIDSSVTGELVESTPV